VNPSQLIAKLSQDFLEAGIESAEADAKELICHALSISKSDLMMLELENKLIDERQLTEIIELSKKRQNRVPLQHLTGISFFRNLELLVGPGVFVPRPETESLVELALGLELPEKTSIEIGTGSGAISIALSTEGQFEATAIEVSTEAASWAEKNIAKSNANVNLQIQDFNLFSSNQKYGLLISNPPYIPSGAIPVDPEVNLYDPEIALYSGEDGLDLIRVLADSKHLLLAGGVLLFEHDESQRESIVQLLLDKGWQNVRHFQDLNGRDRFIQAVA
jgi:release factor glutamine methyltransferase